MLKLVEIEGTWINPELVLMVYRTEPDEQKRGWRTRIDFGGGVLTYLKTDPGTVAEILARP